MKAISLGLSISFTGILTFKKSQALRELAAELPADRIMVETNTVIWRPENFAASATNPLRGGNCQGAPATREKLEEISRQTTRNFFRLFGEGPAPKEAAAIGLDDILALWIFRGIRRPALG